MGYRGKTAEQNRARELRAAGHTYNEIAGALGVSKSSVSLWCRDVEPDEDAWAARVRANKNFGARRKRPHRQQLDKQAEIERLRREGIERIGRLTDKEFLVAGVALYAGEGAKTGGSVAFANSDPRMLLFFATWLRRFFDVDEARLRMRLYLHEGLDLAEATRFWSELLDVPPTQFIEAYRATPRNGFRKAKHPMGCPSLRYSSASMLREVLGLCDALLSFPNAIPG